MTSDNNGVSWNNRVNVTNYIDGELEVDEYRPYTDMNALIDGTGNLHIVWGGSRWPTTAYSDNDAGFYANRIFHWSENQPYIRTVHNADWDQTVCNGGAWNLNASKMTISECRGNLYVLFTQFNDIPNGIENDCADQGSPGYPSGAANGELYISVSGDGGLTWDVARNITNTRTPGCDSVGGVVGPCESENWASMSRFGTNIGNPSDPNVATVVPEGGFDFGYYLDVQYINDHSAGSIVKNDGFWQQADVHWFRMACVDPAFGVPPTPFPSYTWPTYTLQCEEYISQFNIENNGNTDLNYSMVIEEDNGPTGWLSVEPFLSGSIPSGLNNVHTKYVTLNDNGIVCNPLINDRLVGRIIMTSNLPTSPDTIPVDIMILGTPPVFDIDTVNTSCLSLAVRNNGSYGNQGTERVNMDYVNSGDCDTTADIYLYDGSPVLGWIDGADTNMYWSVFGVHWDDSIGFYSTEVNEKYTEVNFDVAKTTFGLLDSSIMMEKTYYAPQALDECNYIIHHLRVWSNDEADHDNLIIGEVLDWDIPSDTVARNYSDFDEDLMAIWQIGAYYDDTTATVYPCAPLRNDSRYGGMAFLTMYDWDGAINTLVTDTDGRPFHNAYTVDNPTFVFGNDNGFNETQLCSLMTTKTGFSTYGSAAPESTYADLHSAMTFTDAYDLVAGETLNVWFTTFTTQIGSDVYDVEAIIKDSRTTFCENLMPDSLETSPNICPCCELRGDMNGDGQILVDDLVALVRCLFDPMYPCDVDCIELVDIKADNGLLLVDDLVYLVDYIFKGGPPPPPC